MRGHSQKTSVRGTGKNALTTFFGLLIPPMTPCNQTRIQRTNGLSVAVFMMMPSVGIISSLGPEQKSEQKTKKKRRKKNHRLQSIKDQLHVAKIIPNSGLRHSLFTIDSARKTTRKNILEKEFKEKK